MGSDNFISAVQPTPSLAPCGEDLLVLDPLVKPVVRDLRCLSGLGLRHQRHRAALSERLLPLRFLQLLEAV